MENEICPVQLHRPYRERLMDRFDGAYLLLRKIASAVFAVALVGFLVTAYLSEVTVDEGTPAMYVTLDAIFYVFCALFAVSAVAYLGVRMLGAMRKVAFYKKLNGLESAPPQAGGLKSILLDLRSPLYPMLTAAWTPLAALTAAGFVWSLVKWLKYSGSFGLFLAYCIVLAALAAEFVLLAVFGKKRKAIRPRFVEEDKLNRTVRAFDVVLFLGMALFCALCIYPIIYVLVGSFNQGADYAIGGVWFLPRIFTFENYRVVLKNTALWHSYLVTIGRTVIGTATALIFTAAVGYAMSRPNLKFKRFFYWVNIITMFFSGGLIPYFLVISSLGLVDNFLVYIIPSLYSVYNMIVIQSGFKSIDPGIHDAATVDGAGELRIWWSIYMPLSKPVLATIVLWLAVGHWNSYFDTMIYTNSENLQTLQYFLLQTIQTSSLTAGMPPEMMEKLNPRTLSLAAIIISIVPVLCFFPLIRKNFASGIMVGSLKG